MRTTLTIDDDLDATLRRLSEIRGQAMRQVINDLLRAGLAADVAPREARPFRTASWDPGRARVVGIHNVHDLLAIAEGEDYR